MNEVQKRTAEEILKVCRKNGVTLDDLLKGILADNTISGSEQCEGSLEVQITSIMKELGVPANILGYKYIRYAIIYALQNPEAINEITKILYPAVAKEFNTTDSRAERAIRHAIIAAWDRSDSETFEKYFGYTIKFRKGKPTNSEFIAMMVEYLKFN